MRMKNKEKPECNQNEAKRKPTTTTKFKSLVIKYKSSNKEKQSTKYLKHKKLNICIEKKSKIK